MIFLGKPILQYALDENYEKALELFKIKKTNLNEKEVFYTNLLLSCKYSHLDYFNYISNWGISRLPTIDKDNELIDAIITNFNIKLGSQFILGKLLKYSKFTKENKKNYKIPHLYTQK